MNRQYNLEEFRFSGSYAGRYMNCHGSAVLAETFPGFTAKATNEFDTTPGGKIRSTVIGTQLHKVFERLLRETEDWIEAAALLDALADVRGAARIDLLTDEVQYITWWFLENNSAPPVEYDIIKMLYMYVPEQRQWDDLNDEEIVRPAVSQAMSPAQIRFIAEALRYVFGIIDLREGATWEMEKTKKATWTFTRPNTTADLVITDGKTLDVVDLKIGTLAVDAFENYQLLYYTETYRTTETTYNIHILQQKKFSILIKTKMTFYLYLNSFEFNFTFFLCRWYFLLKEKNNQR